MDSIKKFIAEQKSTDFMSVSLLCDALQEISERLDAHDRQLKEQDDWIKALEKVMASYEKKEYPVAQAERSCDECEYEKHHRDVLPCVLCEDWSKWQPKAQEPAVNSPEWCKLNNCNPIHDTRDQGGKDKKVSGCFYDHESCDVVDDLRAEVKQVQAQNDHYSRHLHMSDLNYNALRKQNDDLRARLALLEKENAELKRQVMDTNGLRREIENLRKDKSEVKS